MAAAPVLPGPAFAGRSLVLKSVPAGEVWRRMYETRFPDPLGWGPGLNRFSDPTGHAYGVVYLGSSAKVAFVETLLRDATDGRGADCMLQLAHSSDRGRRFHGMAGAYSTRWWATRSADMVMESGVGLGVKLAVS